MIVVVLGGERGGEGGGGGGGEVRGIILRYEACFAWSTLSVHVFILKLVHTIDQVLFIYTS